MEKELSKEEIFNRHSWAAIGAISPSKDFCLKAMQEYAAEQSRSFEPSGGTDKEPQFDNIPDGEYPMKIDGKIDYVKIKGSSISCCNYTPIKVGNKK